MVLILDEPTRGVDIGEGEQPIEEEALDAAPTAPLEAEAPAEAFELLSAPRGAPDDMSKLNGGSPQLAQKLNDAGIFHFWQLAAMTPEDAATIDRDLKLNGRLDREGWIVQARELVAGV